MALDSRTEAALALHRFGLGPRTGSIAAIASDPRRALLAELDRSGAGRIANADLLTGPAAAREAAIFRQARREMRRAAARSQPNGAGPKSAKGIANAKGPAPMPTVGTAPQRLYRDEASARLGAALDAEIGFVERLAWFWSNHFCVSASKGQVRPLAGAFEREAIRAHVLGKFGDMLLAVESHPAMLFYLDNAWSIGPNSPAGQRRGRGLNENLAREILELHTLGVRTVYSQADVTSFAKVITGWTVIPPRQNPQRGGEFVFRRRLHEPGPQTVIGKAYSEAGVEQGRAVLADLAHHPATAKHIARKLARHFVGEDHTLIVRLEKVFRDTGGDLKELAKALVVAPESWSAPRARLKRPAEWIVGALRATGARPNVQPVIQAQNLLGEPLWRPPAPNGFSDDDATWLAGLSQRLDIANQFARRVAGDADPMTVFEDSIAPIASEQTRRAIMRAESRPQALALLFMAPEFQRR
ncbi:MAG: DUF1800 domain-containing protein [Xanthobacteraceae bacterium]